MSTSTILDARYELRARIGRGGMAEVFQAWDRRLGREVAVKLLNANCSQDTGLLERFRQESHALAQLNHPNIVTLFDSGETSDRRFYLVMERLHGQPFDAVLRDLHENGAVLGWRRTVEILRPVCAALHAAHGRQIVHRDIKPSNLFLHRPGGDESDNEFVKILDFGIVKMLAGAEQRPGANVHTLTSSGLFIGTPHYAAPEAIEPQIFGPVGVPADVYALGVIMYQCLTGVLPFQGEPRARAVYRTAYEDPPSLRVRAPERMIAPAIDAVVMRALARRPEDRYRSVRALLAALQQLPDEPTAPHAVIAARSVAGQIDLITQVQARDKKQTLLGMRVSRPAQETPPAGRPLRRTVPEFSPVAMAPGDAPNTGGADIATGAKPVSRPALRLDGSALRGAAPAPASRAALSSATVSPTRRGSEPELATRSPQNPATAASGPRVPEPLEFADTPVPGSTLMRREQIASSLGIGIVLAVLALSMVIGAAWWFMPEAPMRPPQVERR